jgi:hypothetical protein
MAIQTIETDQERLAEIDLRFTAARLAFNDAYQRFFNYQKTHGPSVVRSGDTVNIQFLPETLEGKQLAISATETREDFYRLLRERAELLMKLKMIR